LPKGKNRTKSEASYERGAEMRAKHTNRTLLRLRTIALSEASANQLAGLFGAGFSTGLAGEIFKAESTLNLSSRISTPASFLAFSI